MRYRNLHLYDKLIQLLLLSLSQGHTIYVQWASVAIFLFLFEDVHTPLSLPHSRLIKTCLGDTFMSLSSSHCLFFNKVSKWITFDIFFIVFSPSPALTCILWAVSKQRAIFLLSPAHVGGVASDGNQMLLLSIIYDAGGEKRDLFHPEINHRRRMSMVWR